MGDVYGTNKPSGALVFSFPGSLWHSFQVLATLCTCTTDHKRLGSPSNTSVDIRNQMRDVYGTNAPSGAHLVGLHVSLWHSCQVLVALRTCGTHHERSRSLFNTSLDISNQMGDAYETNEPSRAHLSGSFVSLWLFFQVLITPWTRKNDHKRLGSLYNTLFDNWNKMGLLRGLMPQARHIFLACM